MENLPKGEGIKFQYDYGMLTQQQRAALREGGYRKQGACKLLHVWEMQHYKLKERGRKFYKSSGIIPNTPQEWNKLCEDLDWVEFHSQHLNGWPLDANSRKHLAYWEAGMEILKETSSLVSVSKRLANGGAAKNDHWKAAALKEITTGSSAHAHQQIIAKPKLTEDDAPKKLAKANMRRLALLRKIGVFGKDLKGARIEIAHTEKDLVAAYSLVHAEYVKRGYIEPRKSGMRLRIYEAMPQTATIIAKINKKVVGVLSVVGDTPEMGLPSDKAFKTELDEMRKSGAMLCEFTNQVVLEEYRSTAITTELMRCAFAYVVTEGFDESIASVCATHEGFYNLCCFRQVGAERSYNHNIYDPVVALALNTDYVYQRSTDEPEAEAFMKDLFSVDNSFMYSARQWAHEAGLKFRDPKLLRSLFVEKTSFLRDCSQDAREFLRKKWGNSLFDEVLQPVFPDNIELLAVVGWNPSAKKGG